MDSSSLISQEASVDSLSRQIRWLRLLTYIIAVGTGVMHVTHYPNLFYVKDILKADPGEYTFFNSMASIAWTVKPILAYCEDMVAPFHYRVKSWVGLAASMVCLLSIGVSLSHPTLGMFTVIYGAVNSSAVLMDILAQSLTVTILDLHRSLGETKAMQEDLSPSDIKKAGQAEIAEGKKLYGNYVMARFIIRASSTFIGGLLAKTIRMQSFFIGIAAVQLPVLFFVFFIFKEQRRDYVISPNFHLINNILSFWRSITAKPILFPLLLGLVILLCPDVKDAGTYILTDILHWSSAQVSGAGMCASIIYFIFMLYTINKAKSLGFMLQLFIGATASTINSMMMFRFIFLEGLDFTAMFGLTLVAAFTYNLTTDMVLIPIVARYSTLCPKGIEGFGVTSIAAIVNSSNTISGLFGAKLLSIYKVSKSNYDNLYIPVTMSCAQALLGMLLTPLLGK